VKNLKIILTFVSVIIFLGCSKDDDNIPFFYDAIAISTNETQCQDLKENETREESFTFFVGLENSYIFRFWQGKDEQGNNIFLNKEVKVIE